MKKTSRLPRIHISNTIHHVMIRGNNRQSIFFSPDYFEHFLEILALSTKKFDHKILSYCLMSNHAHLMIYIGESSLSQVMQYINYRYARWLNLKQNRVGHLFQGRYRSIEVCNDKYLINLFRYVHLNPVEARMAKSVSDYPWSSIHFYSHCNHPSWMNIDIVILTLKNKGVNDYMSFVNKPIEDKNWKPSLYLTESGKIAVDESVVRDLYKKRSSILLKKKLLTSDFVFSVVCNYLQLEFETICDKSENHKYCKERILLANFALKYSNIKLSEISKLFQRTQPTLTRQLSRFSHDATIYFSEDFLNQIDKDLNFANERLKG